MYYCVIILFSFVASLTGSVRSEPPLTTTGQRASNLPHRTRSAGSRNTNNTRTRRTEVDSATLRLRPVTPVLLEPVRPASANSRPPNSGAPHTNGPPNSRPPNSGAPPQVPSDSYDYLPPYSPPTAHQRHASEPALLAEPPPSYDEIFGRRRRGEKSRGERSRLSRRSQSHREVLDAPPVDTQPTGRVSNSSRRLISLTKLFGRSRRSSSQTEPVPLDPSTGPADDFTADWVASYSRTPRPFPTTRHESLSVASMSLVDSSASLPVPYRHPPPFTTAENSGHQSTSNQFIRHPPPQLGSSQSLNVLGTRSIGRTRNDHHSNSGQRQDRPRPSSSYVPTENTGSTPSTPNNRTHRLDNSGSTPVISNSCFNILGPTAHTPTPNTPTTSRIRAPGFSRGPSGSTLSLQHVSHLSSNANTNNINAVTSPSPPSTPTRPVECASTPTHPVECASSASTLVHAASVESVTCEADTSGSRAARRLRAETRRLLQQEITVTSEEEQHRCVCVWACMLLLHMHYNDSPLQSNEQPLPG